MPPASASVTLSLAGENAPSFSKAIEYKRLADELSTQIIEIDKKKDPYIYHIQCRGHYNFIQKWSSSKEDKLAQLKVLEQKIIYASSQFPRDYDLDKASSVVRRAVLKFAASLEVDEKF